MSGFLKKWIQKEHNCNMAAEGVHFLRKLALGACARELELARQPAAG